MGMCWRKNVGFGGCQRRRMRYDEGCTENRKNSDHGTWCGARGRGG